MVLVVYSDNLFSWVFDILELQQGTFWGFVHLFQQGTFVFGHSEEFVVVAEVELLAEFGFLFFYVDSLDQSLPNISHFIGFSFSTHFHILMRPHFRNIYPRFTKGTSI
jgi:hypothetical protein